MQWKQIKTLFILCFLALNIYLLVVFINKQEEAEFALQKETDVSLEDQLESENINIDTDLPDIDLNEPYIVLDQKKFNDEDLDALKEKDQETEIINKKLIISEFDESIPIPDDIDKKGLHNLIKDKVLMPEDYTFGGWNQEMNVLMFYRKQGSRPVYYNQNGILLIYLNEDNEMMFYTQSMFKKGDGSSYEEKDLIKPKKAIQKLFDSNKLENGDKITDFKMGYHPRPGVESVFAPTWTIMVNNQDRFYVNAIDDKLYSSDDLTFLTGAVTNTIEKLQMLDEGNDVKNELSPFLKDKLSMIQESE